MHYGKHLRDAFCQWVEEGRTEAETLIETMRGCTDILPGSVCADLDLEQGSTYAEAAERLQWEAKLPLELPRLPNIGPLR